MKAKNKSKESQLTKSELKLLKATLKKLDALQALVAQLKRRAKKMLRQP